MTALVVVIPHSGDSSDAVLTRFAVFTGWSGTICYTRMIPYAIRRIIRESLKKHIHLRFGTKRMSEGNVRGRVMRKRNRGWEVMRRSVMALFLRELKTRFGKYQLGYAWAFIEPVATIGVIFAVLTAFSGASYPGISLPVFIGVGAIANSLFVEISNRSIKAIEANTTLFNYRPVRPIDTVIARTILETMLHVVVFSVLSVIYIGFGGEMNVHDLPTLLLVTIFLATLSCGVGILYMLITDAYSDADKVLPLLNRPVFFISGVFFSVKNIPQEYWPLFLWNPIFHAIELIRGAVAYGYEVEGVSLGYLAFCSILVLTFSMALYHRRERSLRLR